MFRSVFLKTMYEKRWMMLLWGIGVAAIALLMMGFYHSFQQGGFDQVLKSVPKSFQSLVGNAASLKTVSGYVSQEVFALRVPLLTLIMGIVLFSALLAGDESDGTLQTILAQPVSRTRVFIEKYVAGLVISFVICLFAIIGVVLGLLLIHEQLSFLRLLQSVIGVWLLTVLFGTLSYTIGAITAKRGVAGSLAGVVAFSTYLLTSFVGNVPSIAGIEKISPFHYYNQPAIATYGLKGENTLVMLAVIAVLVLIGVLIFRKRDIYQR